jgi:hypothetical protein
MTFLWHLQLALSQGGSTQYLNQATNAKQRFDRGYPGYQIMFSDGQARRYARETNNKPANTLGKVEIEEFAVLPRYILACQHAVPEGKYYLELQSVNREHCFFPASQNTTTETLAVPMSWI